MTTSDAFSHRARVLDALARKPGLPLSALSSETGLPEGELVSLLPDGMATPAPPEAFEAVWNSLLEWEKATFLAITPGAVLEVPGPLPAGTWGHGMFNLHDPATPLGGHLLVERLGAIWFLSKPHMGKESHSVQFYTRDGQAMFAVYVGRGNDRELLPEVKARFIALRARYESASERPLIVYSSRTGNTRRVAEAILALCPAASDLFSVETAPSPAGRPFVAVGFWVDRGLPDALSQAYLERLQGQRVGLFATLGAQPNSDHARHCMEHARQALEAKGNAVVCQFMCQGRVDPSLASAMWKHHPPTPERLARLREAERHPDEWDLQAAQDAFRAQLAGTPAAADVPAAMPAPATPIV